MIFPRKVLKIHLGHKNRSFRPFWKWRGGPRQEVIYLFPLLTVSRLKLKNIFQRQSRSTEGRMPWPKETKGRGGEKERERDRGREWKKKSNDPLPWRRFRITTMLELKFKSSKFGGQDIVWSRWNYFPPGTRISRNKAFLFRKSGNETAMIYERLPVPWRRAVPSN